MNRAESIVFGVLCVGCLAVPIILLLGGALDAVEPDQSISRAEQLKSKGMLEVRRFKSGKSLPVHTHSEGRAVVERSAGDIPTTEVQGRTHTDANDIPVRTHSTRGLQPEASAGE